MQLQFPAFLLAIAACGQLVAGHGAITAATGDKGGAGTALGIIATTPRDGSTRKPFEQDTTVFKGPTADACGETLAGGANNPAAQVAQVMAANGGKLPQISPGGAVLMTLHQVNGDGAGPYTCMIDATGTGTQFTPITVTQNVPGKNSRSNARAEDFPLNAQIPAAQNCTGAVAGQTGVCMVKCQNAARAGPFGGCVPVQLAAGGSAAASATAAAAATAEATTAASTAAATSTSAAAAAGNDAEDDAKKVRARARSFKA